MATKKKLQRSSEPDKWTERLDEAFEAFAIRGEHVSPVLRQRQERLLRSYVAALEDPRAVAAELERRHYARVIFEAAVDAVYFRGPEGDRWLRETSRALRRRRSAPTLDAKRYLVVQAVRCGDIVEARSLLKQADPRFVRVTDDALRDALTKNKRGIYSACADLSISVHAFGETRRASERRETARNRVAKVFREAAKRRRPSDHT